MDAALNVFTTGNKSGERVLYLVHGHPDHEIYKVVVSPEVAVQGAVVFRILIIMITHTSQLKSDLILISKISRRKPVLRCQARSTFIVIQTFTLHLYIIYNFVFNQLQEVQTCP